MATLIRLLKQLTDLEKLQNLSVHMEVAVDESRRVAVGSAVGARWVVVKILGEGAFGAVYEVTDSQNPDKFYALKLESNAEAHKGTLKLLPLEVMVLRALRDNGAQHYPGYVSCGKNEQFNYVVTGLVGKNVQDLRRGMPAKMFSLRTTLHLAEETLLSLSELHEVGYLHRDVKPANICIGRAPDDLRGVYILDWGLCRRYLNAEGQVHRPRSKAPFRGTLRYASVNALNDEEQSRADDMWSWFMLLVELTVGRLPWDDLEKPFDQRGYMQWIAQVKPQFMEDPQQICNLCPREYLDVHRLLKGTGYFDRPDYAACIQLIDAAMKRKGIGAQEPLDWEPKEGEPCDLLANLPDSPMMPLWPGTTSPKSAKHLGGDGSGRGTSRSVGNQPVSTATLKPSSIVCMTTSEKTSTLSEGETAV